MFVRKYVMHGMSVSFVPCLYCELLQVSGDKEESEVFSLGNSDLDIATGRDEDFKNVQLRTLPEAGLRLLVLLHQYDFDVVEYI